MSCVHEAVRRLAIEMVAMVISSYLHTVLGNMPGTANIVQRTKTLSKTLKMVNDYVVCV